jgi:Family of unknown function (DUF6918)
MPTLKEQLGSGDKRREVIEDSCRVLDQEVADRSGLTGMAIKGGYKLVQGIKPGFIRDVVDALLNDFLEALEPVYCEAIDKKRPAGAYLLENKSRVADALLSVTDKRAQKSESGVIKKAYEKLRPLAKGQVEAATPRLSKMLERHAAPTV